METLTVQPISLHAQRSALCHCTMSLHYLNALFALYDYTPCILSALSHCALCAVCIAGPSHQACKTVFRVPSLEQCSSESRCEKHSVCPHSASVLKQVTKRRKLSSRRLAPRAERRTVNGLSKINSLILLTAFVIRIFLLFYEMQVLPGMSIAKIQ